MYRHHYKYVSTRNLSGQTPPRTGLMFLGTSRIVRTVRGDVDPSELGATDSHEYLFLSTRTLPGDDFTDLAPTIEEARTLAVVGAKALVDWTPIGLGRYLGGLRAISETTGLHVIRGRRAHTYPHRYSGLRAYRARNDGPRPAPGSSSTAQKERSTGPIPPSSN